MLPDRWAVLGSLWSGCDAPSRCFSSCEMVATSSPLHARQLDRMPATRLQASRCLRWCSGALPRGMLMGRASCATRKTICSCTSCTRTHCKGHAVVSMHRLPSNSHGSGGAVACGRPCKPTACCWCCRGAARLTAGCCSCSECASTGLVSASECMICILSCSSTSSSHWFSSVPACEGTEAAGARCKRAHSNALPDVEQLLLAAPVARGDCCQAPDRAGRQPPANIGDPSCCAALIYQHHLLPCPRRSTGGCQDMRLWLCDTLHWTCV